MGLMAQAVEVMEKVSDTVMIVVVMLLLSLM